MYSFRDEHLGRLLQSAYRDFNARTLKKLRRLGYRDLTQFQSELMSYITLGGTRIKNLVATTQTTKQAIGEAVARLVEAGYLQKRVDTADHRAQLLYFTPKGEQFLLDAHRVKAGLEQDYTTLLGQQNFRQLRSSLQTLAIHKK